MIYQGSPIDQPIDLFRVLQAGLEAAPDNLALACAGRGWSWRQLDQASDNLAGNLLRLGLEAGDRVASLMPNRAALLIHYLACIKAGLVATPLNYRYMPPEIDHALGLSGAAVIVAHAERADDIGASQQCGRLPLGVIWYGDKEGGAARFDDLTRPQEQPPRLARPDPDAPAFIFFTSGSTGKPKGVTHSATTFGWMVAAAVASMELTGEDIVLPGSSLSHVGALLMTLAGFAAGARVDVARTFDGDELLPLLRETRPTALVMLPAALIALVRDHDARPDDFRSLRVCMSGGDKVPAELEREFTEISGFAIDEGYGMTEFGISNLNPPSGINKPGSVGAVCAGFAQSIRNEEGQAVAAGTDGRLWVKAPSVMTGYWNNAAATAETIQDGWLDTGDIMCADSDGYLWFRGRKKQIIVHDGSNICPQEVEEALLEHPAVANVGVIGVHNLVHGENVRAYIELQPGAARPTSQELIRFARARVGYKAPEEIEILDEIPLNPTGKVDRVALKQLAQARHEIER